MRIHLHPWALASAAAMALGCGGAASNGLGDTSGASSSSGSGSPGSPADQADATLSNFGDTDGGFFVPAATNDAGVVVQSGPCSAGVYQGKYMTYVGAGGDGGSPGIFSFMWNGSLTIDLTAQKITMSSTTVGELPTTTTSSTLEIADGGALDGSDTMGGTFFANLVGSLDCAPDAGPPYRLTASLSNGRYRLPYFATAMIGHLTADYQEAGAGTPPMLVNGQILVAGVFTDGGAPYASASGTWSATWISAQ